MRTTAFFLFIALSFLSAQTGWYKVSPGSGGKITSFAEDSDQNLYLLSADRIYKSDSTGMNWAEFRQLPDSFFVYFTINGNNTFFASTWWVTYRSTDFGGQWDSVFRYAREIVSKGDTCYSTDGLSYIYHSYDDGQSWDTPDVTTGASQVEIIAMALGPSGEIYVSDVFISMGIGVDLSLSTDGGRSFHFLRDIGDLQNHDIIVNSRGELFVDTLVSRDRGQSWEAYTRKTISGKFDVNHQDILYKSQYSGRVYEFSGKDSTWKRILTLPEGERITATFIDSRDYYYVGTDSGYVYRTAIATGLDKNEPFLPQQTRLYANYPNPFNPETLIPYRLMKREKVELSVFDITGRKIATLLNKVEDAGEHTVRFDASGLAGGVYIYRLKSASFVDSRKMVLLR